MVSSGTNGLVSGAIYKCTTTSGNACDGSIINLNGTAMSGTVDSDNGCTCKLIKDFDKCDALSSEVPGHNSIGDDMDNSN